jgi:hypothetical protein
MRWHAILAAGAALAPQAARAAELEWQAPEGCPVAAEVEALVDDDAWQLEWSARGHVERSEDAGFVLSLELVLESQRSERVLEAASCDELARAAAAIIQLAVLRPEQGEPAVADWVSVRDDDVEVEAARNGGTDVESDAGHAAESEPRPARSRLRLRGSEQAPLDRGPQRRRGDSPWHAFGGLGLDDGSLRLQAAALRVGGGYTWGRWRWLGSLGYLSYPVEEEETIAAGGPTVTTRSTSHLWVVESALCLLPVDRALQLAACAGAETGVYYRVVKTTESDQSSTAPWFAPTASLGVGFGRGRFRPNLLAEGLAPLLRPAEEQRSRGELAGRILATAEYRF